MKPACPPLFHNDNRETKQYLTCPSTPHALLKPRSSGKTYLQSWGNAKGCSAGKTDQPRSTVCMDVSVSVHTCIYLMIITSFQQQAMCLLQPKMILLFQRREICKSKVRERLHRAANIKKITIWQPAAACDFWESWIANHFYTSVL